MLYPILVEHYIWFSLLLLGVTWWTRRLDPNKRSNFLYGYGMLATLGFVLAFEWMAGVIFGLLCLEVGRVFKMWLNKKETELKKNSEGK